MGTENELTENEVDAIVQYFDEIAIKMRGLDKAKRFAVITSILDWYARRIVTNEFSQADVMQVQAHLTVTLHNSLPPEVLEADGFLASNGPVIRNVLDTLGKLAVESVEKGSDPKGTLVSKSLTITVLEHILLLLGATPHLRFEYGIAHGLVMQKFAQLYPEGLEKKELESFLAKEIESNMEMLLSDPEEYKLILEGMSEDNKKSTLEIIMDTEKDQELMKIYEKLGWTRVHVLI
jgi:hypothetical protein